MSLHFNKDDTIRWQRVSAAQFILPGFLSLNVESSFVYLQGVNTLNLVFCLNFLSLNGLLLCIKDQKIADKLKKCIQMFDI